MPESTIRVWWRYKYREGDLRHVQAGKVAPASAPLASRASKNEEGQAHSDDGFKTVLLNTSLATPAATPTFQLINCYKLPADPFYFLSIPFGSVPLYIFFHFPIICAGRCFPRSTYLKCITWSPMSSILSNCGLNVESISRFSHAIFNVKKNSL